MTPGEVIRLLNFAESFGLPKATQAVIGQWHDALSEADFDEAQAAVVMHYRESPDPVTDTDVAARCLPPPPAAEPFQPGDEGRWHRMWLRALADSGEACAHRRAVVAAHPEIAARLRQPPLGYQHRDQWNGFIPPEIFSGKRNASARRDALVSIHGDAIAAAEAEAAAAPEARARADAA